MTAPTKSFTVIPDTDIDPDSPITTGLMTALRDNDQNMMAQLVGEPLATPVYAPEKFGHTHDGVNSAPIVGSTYMAAAFEQLSVGYPLTSTSTSYATAFSCRLLVPLGITDFHVLAGYRRLSVGGHTCQVRLQVSADGGAAGTVTSGSLSTGSGTTQYNYLDSGDISAYAGAYGLFAIQYRMQGGTPGFSSVEYTATRRYQMWFDTNSAGTTLGSVT